jgi:Cu/Ag efflux pump CusA
MTTLTTAMGMLPLAIGIGEGAEMLRPLAVTIVAGLTFSMLVSLVLVPVMYELTHMREWRARMSMDGGRDGVSCRATASDCSAQFC